MTYPAKTAQRQILLVVGEASGDLHGAHLVRAIRERDPAVAVSAVAGEGLKAEGVNVLYDVSAIAGMGSIAPVPNLPAGGSRSWSATSRISGALIRC